MVISTNDKSLKGYLLSRLLDLAVSTAAISTFKQIQGEMWKLKVLQKCKSWIMLKPDGGTTEAGELDQLHGLM